MTRIGYMGVPYSNTWVKTLEFLPLVDADAETVPLMTARATVERLEAGDIDYGVLAFTNTIAGDVQETAEALRGKRYEKVCEGGLPVHHCLFVKSPGQRIDAVYSHRHALDQCRNTLGTLCPDAVTGTQQDTAHQARLLAEGGLPDGAAVICRKEAGEHWGLTLVRENIEDGPDNVTTFAMIRLRGDLRWPTERRTRRG